MRVYIMPILCGLSLSACMVDPSQETPSDVFSGGQNYNLSPQAPVTAPVVTEPEVNAVPRRVEAARPQPAPVQAAVAPEPAPAPAAAPETSSTGDSFTVVLPKGELRAEQVIGNCASGLNISSYRTQFLLSGGRQSIRVNRPSGVSVDQFRRFENCVKNLFEGAQSRNALNNTPANQPL